MTGTTQTAGHPAGRWYYGWNIVAAAAVLTLLSIGLRLGIGPFFLPMATDLGFSRSLLGGIIAVGMLVYGLAMPLAGWLVARWGTRAVLLSGAAMVLGGAAWTVLARGPLGFLCGFGLLLSVGLAFVSPVALTPVISHWFVRRRGMALFFLSTGSMAGIAVLTPVLSVAVEAFGWRTALLGMCALFMLVTLPACWIIRDDPPPHADLRPDDTVALRAHVGPQPVSLRLTEAMRTAPFWQVAFGLFGCGFSMNLLGTHGVPMLMDHGFDSMTSALGIGMTGFVAIFSTLVLGRVADRLQRKDILAVIYIARGLTFFALVAVGTHWELYVAAAIGGLVWAGSVAMSSAILADVYGVRLVGVLYGLAYVGHQIAGTISSWLGGWAYDVFGTHWVSFGAAGALLLLGGVVSLRLPTRGFTLMGVPRPA